MRAAYRELLIRLRSSLASGVPLRDALAAIAGPTGATARGPGRLAFRLLQAMEAGQGLGEAMASMPRDVPPVHAALVRAGEESGQLVDILSSVVQEIDVTLESRRALLQWSAYPIGVLAFALVVPRVAFLVVTGQVLDGFVLDALLALLAAGVALLVWGGPRLLPRAARRLVERGILAVPFLRTLVADCVLGRVLALEGLLLGAGLLFEDSLPLVRDAAGWETVGDELDAARRDIQKGRTAAESFRRLTHLSPDVLGRLAAAESAGRLDEALREAGEEMRRRYRHRERVTLRVLPILFYLLIVLVILRLALSVLPSYDPADY
ncbi:MAG: type II secretion system F family protein [Planctomycetota bacterium]|nr:type II secretion system F family protein [Planctomycetota bacterium]